MIVAYLALVLTTQTPTTDLAPRARVQVSPKEGGWVGQCVTLTITLATPDLFAGVPVFEFPPIPGAIVLPPAGSPDVGSERVDDTTFTTQRHAFSIYAQRPGTIHIPPIPIRFESNAGYGKPTIARRVTAEEVSFTAKNPPGAEELGTVIATADLEVAADWQPEPKTPKVGDAFTLTVTVTASDVPGMVLPPLRFGPINGVAAYPKEPVVNDQTVRGELTGRRTDTVTFICERPGTVTIPDRALSWFDLTSEQLKTERIGGRTFEVAPDPKSMVEQGPSAPEEPERGGWWRLPALVAIVILSGLLVRGMWTWWKQIRAARAGSETAFFARFGQACRAADAHTIYVAFLGWLDHFGPMTVHDFTDRAGDPQLTQAVNDLRNRLYSRSDRVGPWTEAHALFVRAKLARRRLRTKNPSIRAAHSIPPLNPGR